MLARGWHAIGKEQHRFAAILKGEGNGTKKPHTIGQHHHITIQGIVKVARQVRQGRGSLHELMHDPRRFGTKLEKITAGCQNKGGVFAFKREGTTVPAPTHPFSQIFLVIVRVSLDPRLRPRNDERTAQPHAHAMPALLASMRAVYVSAWEAS